MFIHQLLSLYYPALAYIMDCEGDHTNRSDVHVVCEMRHLFSKHIMFSSNISVQLEAL